MVCAAAFPLAKEYGFTYLGGHPMAGTQYSGFKNAKATMYHGAPMVIVPPDFDDVLLFDHVKQLLINLIDNAIKYSNPGSTITVSAEEVGNMIQVTVTDNGVGISEADLPHVKTKFFKANHTRRGSGIGLAVADEIISMHGGRLDITSELNVGTNVTITLPVESQLRSIAST